MAPRHLLFWSFMHLYSYHSTIQQKALTSLVGKHFFKPGYEAETCRCPVSQLISGYSLYEPSHLFPFAQVWLLHPTGVFQTQPSQCKVKQYGTEIMNPAHWHLKALCMNSSKLQSYKLPFFHMYNEVNKTVFCFSSLTQPPLLLSFLKAHTVPVITKCGMGRITHLICLPHIQAR